MADFGIKPDIALGYQGIKPQTVNDIVGTAKGVMEFKRLSELYPEVIAKTKAERASAETQAKKGSLDYNMSVAKTIADGQTSMITNPLIQRAAQDPSKLTSDDRKNLVALVTENAIQQSRNAGIPWEGKGQELAQPYITMAMNNPGGLAQYYKERMMVGLDSAERLSRGVGQVSEVAGQPQLVNPMLPRPVQPIPGIAGPAPLGGRTDQGANLPMPAAQPNQFGLPSTVGGPIAPAQPAAAPIAPRGVQSADMTARVGGPGFELPYRKPVGGVINPQMMTDQFKADETSGSKYRQDLAKSRMTVPAGIRNVDEVLRGAAELAKSVDFTTGKPAEIERAIRQFFGDERYKELSKNIANTQIAIASAQGASTDSMRELISRATGTEDYPPRVLITIASRLRGELKGLDLEAQAAQKFSTKFGDANLPAFRNEWAKNADTRVFEAMSIMDSRMDKAAREKALDKILPTDREDLIDFQRRYKNLESLTKTGTLPR